MQEGSFVTIVPALRCAILAGTLHFPATPTSFYLSGFDLEVSVVDWGQAHKQSDHTHIRKLQITANQFSFLSSHPYTHTYIYMNIFVICALSHFDDFHYLIPNNRYDKTFVRGTQL